MPLFSLVIPVYNVEPYLTKCFDSILAQKFEDWEAILVNDGSTDHSGAICDDYAAKDPRFRVFHKPNGGVSTARNMALDNARGEWIWFVDSDDYIEKDAFSTLYDTVIKYSCDTIFFGMRILNQHSEENYIPPFITDLSHDSFLSRISCFANPTMLFSNNIIRKQILRFTEGIKMGEDLEFQYKYLIFARLPISINHSLYAYMRREESAMSNPHTHMNNYKDCFDVAINLSNFIKFNHVPYSGWLMIRIRQIIKSAMQSAMHLSGEINLKDNLRDIIERFENIGWGEIKDSTIQLALFDHNLYFGLLRIYKFLN